MKLFGNKNHPSHLKKKSLPGWKRVLLIVALCLVILAGSLAGLYMTMVKPPDITTPPQIQEELKQEEEETFTPPTVIQIETKVDEETGEEITVETEVPASHKEGFYNLLLCGTDDDGMRTDTIIIGRINTQDHTVALLSVPRDTLISGNYSVPKINSVFGANGAGEKGMEALASRLAQLLGFEVDGYVLINLDAFVELVDLVGGVEFDVPMDMDYEDASQDLYIHLKKGVQLLDGQQSMQVVRFRKGYATQDIQRTKTQQQFLQALANKCLSELNLGNIGEIAQIFMDNVTTNLSLGNIAYFGQELLKCDFDNMFSYTLEGEAVMVNGASCYAIYQNKTLEIVNEYFNPYETAITAANVSIRTPEIIRAELAQQEQTKEPEEELPEEETPEEEDPVDVPTEEVPNEPEPEPELPTDPWETVPDPWETTQP